MQEIHPGDKVTVRVVPVAKKVEVKSVVGVGQARCFHDLDDNEYHISGECGLTYSKPDQYYEIVSVETNDPIGWPPENGDVWRNKSGRDYHILGENNDKLKGYGDGSRLYEWISMNALRNMGPKLVYRSSGGPITDK